MTHEESVIHAIQTALPAVVSIIIGKNPDAVAGDIPEEMWHDIEEAAKEEKTPTSREEIVSHMPRTKTGKVRVGWGSGFLVSKDGHIITNKHVVVDADAEYTVTTAAEDSYIAKVLARDPLNDVAILKIEGDNLPVIALGDSNAIRLGQTAIALGNALGEFQNTVSAGIVSGLSRFLTAMSDDGGHAEHLRGLIQTDAAINPGNSGGPLVDLSGAVIGINAATVFGAENIGFAIPINRAKRDLADVLQYGRIKKPFLGIRYVVINPEIQKKLKLDIDHGIIVRGEHAAHYPGVVKASPADKAGLTEGDIILSVNNQELSEAHSLEDILENSEIGDSLTLQVLQKDGKRINREILLEERK